MFRADGSPVYYQSCRDTGLITIDVTSGPIVIPSSEWSEGLKAGQVVKFGSTRNVIDNRGRYGLPYTVYTDKNKKKLVSWYGFAMP